MLGQNSFQPKIHRQGKLLMKSFNCLKTLIFLVFVLFLFSCKKEQDTEAPEVRILLPEENEVFNYGEYIHVQVEVTDNKTIRDLRIEIRSISNAGSLSTVVLNGNGTSQIFETEILHDGLYLETGEYYIRATANDGEQTSYDFQNIILNAAPRVLQRVMIIRGDANQTFVDSLTGFGVLPATTLNHETDFAVAETQAKRLSVVSNEDEMVHAFTLPDLFPDESFASDADGGEEITAMASDASGRNHFFGYRDGDVSILREDGLFLDAIFQINNHPIRDLLITDQFIITYTVSNDGLHKNINTYLKNSGSLLFGTPVDIEITGMIRTSENNRILLSNNDESEPLVYYNTSTNALNSLFIFMENSPASGIWQTADNNYMVAHESGLTHYNTSTGSFQVYPVFGVKEVYYEPVTGRLFVLSDNQLSIYNSTLTTLVSTYPLQNAKQCVFWYNK